jgi:hypothetical protein
LFGESGSFKTMDINDNRRRLREHNDLERSNKYPN